MRATLQFHPDWPFHDGMVIEAIARDGVYQSQFVTGTSNGALTAYEGGDRWRWESRLFEGRYDRLDPSERPVYGALNRDDRPYGGSVRFGSAYFQLRSQVTVRCTFCYPDSAFQPESVGDLRGAADLLARAQASQRDPLDRYVEAHVHGGVVIRRDVEAVVLDPCYRGTVVERAADELSCRIDWHPGFIVNTATLDPAYRGNEIVTLAQSMGAVLTPDVIGQAAQNGRHDPQDLKRVWHYLACFGQAPG